MDIAAYGEGTSLTRGREMAKANPFVKAWKYFLSWFGAKVDERADPKIQIQQAIEDAQRQHQALAQQAAQVIGNQRQLEMKLTRQLSEVEQLQASARQALVLADQSRGRGDEKKAAEYEQTATAFATQLVSKEQGVEDLKSLHDQSLQAAEQAKKAVENNALMLQQKLAERTQLLSQLEQAKMQEQVSASLTQMSELAAPGNVPSLGEVREKIERRYATALGQAELASTSVEGRMFEVQKSTMDMAGAARLEQIRASIGGGSPAQLPSATPPPAVTQGEPAGEQVSEGATQPGQAAP
jgi:phage shock protein A